MVSLFILILGVISSSTNFDILEDIADPTIFQIPSSCH